MLNTHVLAPVAQRVAAEFKAVRNVGPLRIVLVGPPMAGARACVCMRMPARGPSMCGSAACACQALCRPTCGGCNLWCVVLTCAVSSTRQTTCSLICCGPNPALFLSTPAHVYHRAKADLAAHLPMQAQCIAHFNSCSHVPCAGKTALGARLAKQYGLWHITARDLLTAAGVPAPPGPGGAPAGAGMPPLPPGTISAELSKAVAAEMAGKEPRVSGRNMAALLQA